MPFSIPLVRLQSILAPEVKSNNTFFVELRHNGCQHSGREDPWMFGRNSTLGRVWRLERREDNTILKPADGDFVSNEEEARRELCLLAPSLCHLRLDTTSSEFEAWPAWVQRFTS